MKKINGYMIPKQRKKVSNEYTCAGCGKKLTAKEACFYVDGCNCAITDNSKPYCLECYGKKYGK